MSAKKTSTKETPAKETPNLPKLYLDLDQNRHEQYRDYLQGRRDLIEVHPDLSCRIDNAEVTAPFREVSRMTRSEVMLQFRIKSVSLVRYPEKRGYEHLAPHFALILMPPGETKTESFEMGQQDVVVSLHCRDTYWQQLVSKCSPSLPGWVDKLASGKKPRLHRTWPLTPAMREAASAITNTDPASLLYDLFLQAKCQELIWLAFQTLLKDSESVSPAVSLSRADSARIQQIKAQLDQSFPQMPSLAMIATEIDISDWKLNRGFKSLYGVLPSEYMVALRVQKAKELLANTRLSVTAIALEVGYEYPANFSKAFKQHMGMSPRAFRDAL